MTSETKLNIFLVDDDALFLKSLEIQFRRHYTQSIIETYPSGELCIQHISQNPDIIFLDYYLNGIDKNAMNGMQTLDKIRNINPVTPVVLLSSQDSIDIAVTCMHHKAFDYIVKVKHLSCTYKRSSAVF